MTTRLVPAPGGDPQISTTGTLAPYAKATLELTGLAAAILYGVFDLGYRSFYEKFGVQLEEVGVDHPKIIAQSAVGLSFFLVLVLTAMWFSYLILKVIVVPDLTALGRLTHRLYRRIRRQPPPLMSTPDGTPERPPPWSVPAARLVVLSMLPSATALYLWCVQAPGKIDITSVGFVGFSFLFSGLAWMIVCWGHLHWAQSNLSYKTWATFGLLLGLLMLLFASSEVGRQQAEYLKSNKRPSSTADAPASIMSFAATCVQATPIGQVSVPPASDRLFLLGSSSAVEVIWDATTSKIVRLPTSVVILRSDCPV